jgi:hypothetical protein
MNYFWCSALVRRFLARCPACSVLRECTSNLPKDMLNRHVRATTFCSWSVVCRICSVPRWRSTPCLCSAVASEILSPVADSSPKIVAHVTGRKRSVGYRRAEAATRALIPCLV